MKIKPSSKPGKVLIEVGEEETIAEPTLIKLKKILVPIDFSEESRKALKYAIAFAQQFHAGITLLHVIEPMFYPAEMGYVPVDLQNLEQTLSQGAQDKLRALAEEEIKPAIKSEVVVTQGRTFQTIANEAKQREIDLIIMGSHGRSGLKHVLLGSTTERVVRHAPCPVMVVREKEHEFV